MSSWRLGQASPIARRGSAGGNLAKPVTPWFSKILRNSGKRSSAGSNLYSVNSGTNAATIWPGTIRHGFLYGFDEGSPQREAVRARRIFCSNRQARPGCGRTFSVWCADKIRRLSLTAGALWRFLQCAVADGILVAIRGLDCQLSDRTLQRIWKRFDRAQSKIRTALCSRCPPPQLLPRPPANPAQQPAAQVLAHLQAAFPDVHCPIAAFQQSMRTFFV